MLNKMNSNSAELQELAKQPIADQLDESKVYSSMIPSESNTSQPQGIGSENTKISKSLRCKEININKM
jgi:hypothetical protein